MTDKTIHILLVEDEAAHAELIKRAFVLATATHVSLTVASTLQEARQRLADTTPDLMICDLKLPDGNGIELIPGERETAPYPVLIMTSHGDENIAVTAMKAGAMDYVVKSETSFSQLPRTVTRSLREWNNMVERRRAEKAVKLNEDRLESLFKVSQTPWAAEDELINASLEEGVRLTGSHVGYLHFYNEDEDTIFFSTF